ncbi:uncharacterized protein LOC114172218 [Vigna unguiculata]|uniref:uncharacterized protein LOC114172218 n=1 Tax=Vigna unguiculata TaxID=3917 RepID=UPI0010169B88|nr:uncharacterized protein LOC114172218 [Vigna unguiculata]XP_027912617.1 uncharacterized protein LOC114172218 [Vigna unguiculata]
MLCLCSHDSRECVISIVEMKNEREILCTGFLYKISWVEVTRDRALIMRLLKTRRGTLALNILEVRDKEEKKSRSMFIYFQGTKCWKVVCHHHTIYEDQVVGAKQLRISIASFIIVL